MIISLLILNIILIIFCVFVVTRTQSVKDMPPLPSETELGQKFELLLDRRGVKGAQREQVCVETIVIILYM